MNLHEYQAKQLFAEYGLPVAAGIAAKDPAEAVAAAKELGGEKWVVKAQVHAGGRGKAGGVKVAKSIDEVRDFAAHWLGRRLVTYQTDADGQPVACILVEACADIAEELYLGAVVDRASCRIVFMASTEGGVDIEKVAAEQPEKILKTAIDPLTGPQPYQGRQLAFGLGLGAAAKGASKAAKKDAKKAAGKDAQKAPDRVKQFTGLFMGLAKMFQELDLSLLEINPLVITGDGHLLCLDGKINVDGNALFRQPRLREMHDPSQDDPREAEAAAWNLNYVALDGDIGCLVNGAGLAMGTMDMVQLYGGSPANFLDVGGGATAERVAEAFKLILSDGKVRAVLVNIFGGIVRCDLIAEGIIAAVGEVGVQVPVVVRLEGNNAAKGRQALQASGLNLSAAEGLADAAKKAVEAAHRHSPGFTDKRSGNPEKQPAA